MQKGLIHLYIGDGKGKTTAAVGLSVRARGSGLRVVFAQFLKGRASGEQQPLETLGVTVLRHMSSQKFVFSMTDEERKICRTEQAACLQEAADAGKTADLLVLDEVFGALSCGMLEKDAVLALLKNKPAGLEAVLTGRDPAPEFLALADYISEVQCVRHPYEKGVTARRGIEY